VLFTAAWILSLVRFTASRRTGAETLLAIPSAIKVYPGLMLAVPLSIAATWRQAMREIGAFIAALALAVSLIPALAYGGRALPLEISFFRNVIFNQAEVRVQQRLMPANQSLDTVLLRYLTDDPGFHARYPDVPHAGLSKSSVLMLGNACRALILISTIAAVWRWRRRRRVFGTRDLLAMAALWSATLYMLMPETKARYAVYTTMAFLPLIELAGSRLAALGAAASVAVVAGLIPESLRVYGIGLAGPVVRWSANVWLVARRPEERDSSPQGGFLAEVSGPERRAARRRGAPRGAGRNPDGPIAESGLKAQTGTVIRAEVRRCRCPT
jgi:hypothetical protein